VAARARQKAGLSVCLVGKAVFPIVAEVTPRGNKVSASLFHLGNS
jgi:hypothetical protein